MADYNAKLANDVVLRKKKQIEFVIVSVYVIMRILSD